MGLYLLCDIEVTELQPAVLITTVCAVGGGVRQQGRGSSARTQSVPPGVGEEVSLREVRASESQASSGGLQSV